MIKRTVFSHKGKYRSTNEDCAVCKVNEGEDHLMFAIADGMGNLDYGDMASKLVVDTIIQYLENSLKNFVKETTLLESLAFADGKLEDFCIKNNCRSGVAIALGVIQNNLLTFSWQGNVRIYLCSGNVWTQLTTDHKLYIEEGTYRLTRCLKGQGLRDDIPLKTINIHSGDSVLACTDGLYEGVRDIAHIPEIIYANILDSHHIYDDDCTGILIDF